MMMAARATSLLLLVGALTLAGPSAAQTPATLPSETPDTLRPATGRFDYVRRILAELTEARARRVVSAWGIAAVHASLGDVDEAFRWLEIAIEERASGLILLRVHPRLDPIRTDPRYLPLIRRLGLESAGPSSG
jgi:hypothetical protein